MRWAGQGEVGFESGGGRGVDGGIISQMQKQHCHLFRQQYTNSGQDGVVWVTREVDSQWEGTGFHPHFDLMSYDP